MKQDLLALGAALFLTMHANAAESGLVGHWKLQGDCRDYSALGNHAINHGVKLERGQFDGVTSYIEVPNNPSLRFGIGDFSISAWVYTEKDLDDVIGDVIDKYDPAQRRGITLTIHSTGSGYSGQGNDRQVFFGIDNAHTTDWVDCGKPSPTSRYISNSMLVFQGKLYAATTDAQDESDWCHVFRYESKGKWVDCGRVGAARTTGVGPLLVHNGDLYAVTRTYDWTRISDHGYDPGRVYRYAGGTNWIDCGQPSNNRTLNTAASYKGKIYVGGGPETWGAFVQDGANSWKVSSIFSKDGERRCFPHPMSRYNGKLFTGFPAVYSFDGSAWTYAGLPGPLGTVPSLQIHSLTVYQGSLLAGTWPNADVARYLGGEKWETVGRVGEDGTEVNALVVYNGKLYGGSIPRAEVCRYDGQPRWTSLKKFYSPAGWKPGLPGRAKRKEVNEWGRVTSLAIHDGKLFAATGNCTSAIVDNPPGPEAEVFGKVFSMEAGKCVSYDQDMGPGWKHIAAIRERGNLHLYVDGKLVAKSSKFNPADYDISNDRPLRIGFGQTDYFNGRISDVRIYNKAISAAQIRKLFSQKPQ
jgi:hypothetical protein